MGFKDAGKPHYLGHRERLRRRFREGGADAILDYELLELILFRAVPRRDTKPLAKAILARFGSFAEPMNAPDELLREVPGLGEWAVIEIKLVRAAALRLMRGEVFERPVLASWSQVLDYCRASHGIREQGAVPHPVPRQAQSDDRRRGAADGHRGPYPGLYAGGS
jgi:DNA repair protein RadC